MANDDLDTFLTSVASEAVATAPDVTAAPPPEEDASPPPEPASSTVEAQRPDDDAEPPEPIEGEPVVPRRALDALRHQRQDWKAKAIEAETRRAELQKQLDEAKRATAAPPPRDPEPVPMPEIPNPAVDPVGYQGYIERQMSDREFNQRLNFSEMMLRKEVGAEKVDAAIAAFQEAGKRDPALFRQLAAQPDPYGWAYKQVERFKLQEEIGDDPSAYRARIEAEARAKWEAERAIVTPPRVSPAAGMAPSLATARSVAGRNAQAYTGPTPLADILGR